MERNKRQKGLPPYHGWKPLEEYHHVLTTELYQKLPILHAQEQYTERSEGSTSGWEAVTVPGQSRRGGWGLAAGSKWAG